MMARIRTFLARAELGKFTQIPTAIVSFPANAQPHNNHPNAQFGFTITQWNSPFE